MRLTQKILLTFLLGCLLIPAPCAAGDGANEIQAAKQVAEDFLKAEFEGNAFDKRINLIRFSPTREAKEIKAKTPLKPHVFIWDWDPLYVVTSYQITGVTVRDSRAVVTVIYSRLADRAKPGGKIIPDSKERDLVKLKLIRDGERWWVLDPHLPRISRDVLIACYENDLASFDDKWLSKASEEQKHIYRQKQEMLKILKRLSPSSGS
jgi:hypothetical protein